MSVVDQLLKNGVIEQDPENEDKIIYKVPIHIKKDAVEIGGFQAFAISRGWTPTIPNDNGEQVENPISVFEACNSIVWDFVKGIFKEVMLAQLRAKAEQDAQAQVRELL
jgi:hypothetical protein